MNNEIISALRIFNQEIELSKEGYYENDCEIIELDLKGLTISIVFGLVCNENNTKTVEIIEFIECYDSNDNYYHFNHSQINEIEKIIENNFNFTGGISIDHENYDPRTKGETL